MLERFEVKALLRAVEDNGTVGSVCYFMACLMAAACHFASLSQVSPGFRLQAGPLFTIPPIQPAAPQ